MLSICTIDPVLLFHFSEVIFLIPPKCELCQAEKKQKRGNLCQLHKSGIGKSKLKPLSHVKCFLLKEIYIKSILSLESVATEALTHILNMFREA